MGQIGKKIFKIRFIYFDLLKRKESLELILSVRKYFGVSLNLNFNLCPRTKKIKDLKLKKDSPKKKTKWKMFFF